MESFYSLRRITNFKYAMTGTCPACWSELRDWLDQNAELNRIEDEKLTMAINRKSRSVKTKVAKPDEITFGNIPNGERMLILQALGTWINVAERCYDKGWNDVRIAKEITEFDIPFGWVRIVREQCYPGIEDQTLTNDFDALIAQGDELLADFHSHKYFFDEAIKKESEQTAVKMKEAQDRALADFDRIQNQGIKECEKIRNDYNALSDPLRNRVTQWTQKCLRRTNAAEADAKTND